MSNPIKTCLILVTACTIAFLISGYFWLLWLSVLMALIASVSDKAAVLIEKSWFLLSGTIGNIISFIILALVYFCVLFPVSILSRMFRTNNPLQLKDSLKNSLFVTVNKKFRPDDLKEMW